jgi:dephospho-CoA kinase
MRIRTATDHQHGPAGGPRGRARPPLVGLTGGIASGKSTALAAFARQGAATLSSDAVVHELYRRPAVREAAAALLGSEIVGPDGEVDRRRVAARVFADPPALRALEELLHPLVAAELERWRGEAEAAGARLLVHEVPLLFEAGLEDRYDRVLLVTAPEAVRRARAGERYRARSAHQLPEEEKRARADEVYENAGSQAELEAWVASVAERLAPC